MRNILAKATTKPIMNLLVDVAGQWRTTTKLSKASLAIWIPQMTAFPCLQADNMLKSDEVDIGTPARTTISIVNGDELPIVSDAVIAAVTYFTVLEKNGWCYTIS